MKLINQSFEILEQTDFSLIGIRKFIEKCGKLCYKSKYKITDDSYEKFIEILENKYCSRLLEFGTVHLKIGWTEFSTIIRATLLKKDKWNSIWIKYNFNPIEDCLNITTNYRYYLEIKKILKDTFYIDMDEYLTEEDNEYYPKRYTVHFITNKATVDEFRTLINLSYLSESIMYINPYKDEFEKEPTFILPKNWNSYNSLKRLDFTFMWEQAQKCYMSLIEEGCTLQQAREVLPLSIKSELISCGFEDAWTNFIRISSKYETSGLDSMTIEIANKLVEDYIGESKESTNN